MIEINDVFDDKDQTVSEITLRNDLLEVKVLTLGATLTCLKRLDDDINVVVTYQDYQNYVSNPYYLGSMIGPLAGRTKNGQFVLNGEKIQLNLNDKKNHLHGGPKGMHQLIFDPVIADDDRFPALALLAEGDHSKDGYPSKVKYIVTYKLVGSNLLVDIQGRPEKPMPLAITNHPYFNLSGKGSVLDHFLQMEAREVYLLDDEYVNDGKTQSVVHSAFDFRAPKPLQAALDKGHPQFDMTRGLDHAFHFKDSVLASLFDPKTKKSLTLSSSAKDLVVYSANFFDQGFINGAGEPADNYSGLALEPGVVANGVNFLDPVLYDQNHPFDLSIRYQLT